VCRARADRTHGRSGLTTAEREELARWRKENRILAEEREILKGGGIHRKAGPVRVGGKVLIRRYGASSVGATVAKALTSEVPQLARTDADRRILMLEYHALSGVGESALRNAVGRLAPGTETLLPWMKSGASKHYRRKTSSDSPTPRMERSWMH
jgi:hypothetical protein